MPINLSFRGRTSTDAFYTPIHRNIAAHAVVKDLPPTPAEFAAWLAEAIPDPAGLSVLDAGCGAHGLNARTCRSHGFAEVRAIDSNVDAVRAGRDIGVTAGDLLDLPFLTGYFDLVICSGVAHHTVDPARAFKELARVLKPDGRAYISVYAFRASLFEYVVRILRLIGKLVPYRFAHTLFGRIPALNNFVLDHMYVPVLWLFRASEIRQICKDCGLTVDQEFPSRFDVYASRRFGKGLVGDGLLRVFVCRKQR
jgi:SAM-dependent methyltransferase